MRRFCCMGSLAVVCGIVLGLLTQAPTCEKDAQANKGKKPQQKKDKMYDGYVCPIYPWANNGSYCSYYAEKCDDSTYVNLDTVCGANCGPCSQQQPPMAGHGCEYEPTTFPLGKKRPSHRVKKCLANDGMAAKVKAADLRLDPDITENAAKAVVKIVPGAGRDTFFALLVKADVVPAQIGRVGPRQTFCVGHQIMEAGQEEATIQGKDIIYSNKHHFVVKYNKDDYTVISYKDTK